MKKKIKSFGFWSALSGAIVVLLNSLGRAFGFYVQEQLVSDIIMAIAGVLVVLGVVTMPKDEQGTGADSAEDVDEAEESDQAKEVQTKDEQNKKDGN